jgi:hypothetical protein
LKIGLNSFISSSDYLKKQTLLSPMDTHKWTSQIDKNTRDFQDAFGALTHDQLNWKPNAKTWSVAQNIDHLIVINRTYFPTFEAIQNGIYDLPFLAKFNFVVAFLGKSVLKAVQPDRKNKMKTFSMWEPGKSEIPSDILEKFEEQQRELKQWIEQSADLLDKGTIISSPANKMIVYKLETAFDIIVTHEQRHFNQATEVLSHL